MIDYQSFLREISPYIVVVGSFARGEETELSDIDCFLRSRPRDELDENMSNETYMPEVLAIVKKHGLEWSSVFCGHIAVEQQPGFPRMIEISSHYRIPHMNQPFYRDVDGVQLMCAQDNKRSEYDDCYDHAVWDDALSDMVIPHPLPTFDPPKVQVLNAPTKESLETKIQSALAKNSANSVTFQAKTNATALER